MVRYGAMCDYWAEEPPVASLLMTGFRIKGKGKRLGMKDLAQRLGLDTSGTGAVTVSDRSTKAILGME